MPEKPTCNRMGECNLEIEGNKRGSAVTAECVTCDFMYEVERTKHKNSGIGNHKKPRGGGTVIQSAFYGPIPEGLQIGKVADVVNGALIHPGILDHLTIAVIE